VLLFAVPPVAFRDPFDRTLQAPRIVAIIPARFQSSRFPGKPLADVAGRPMIEHVYRRAAAAPSVDAVIVATDDQRIASAVEGFGGIARLTRSSHPSGTDRLAEVAADVECEIVVNVQGDEPLIEPEMIEKVIEPLGADAGLDMATLRRPIADHAEYMNPNLVKVVVDRQGNALYFSRAPIPHARGGAMTAYAHIGIYAYRRPFLLTYAGLQPTPLELMESLEQLRALEHGYRIRTVETRHESIGVDTPEDLDRVRRLVTAEART
jgi:3-deoxy-manno-octulosonate cytidylyltransferase (CMP-KDO synthetase)